MSALMSMSSRNMSSRTLFKSSLLVACLSGFSGFAAFSACDKGPKAGEPAPAAKATEDVGQVEPAAAAAAAASDVAGKVYGAGVGDSQSVSIADISADPQSFEGKTVRVEGMVTDVCVKRGCWFEMAGNAPGEKIRFKVDDGEMVFPVDAKGKRAVAEGKLVTKVLTVEEARAQAEYFAKESGKEFDPASITEGSVSFQIQGTGAVIGETH
jgi:cytochrome c-type biogenesis protein CcmE